MAPASKLHQSCINAHDKTRQQSFQQQIESFDAFLKKKRPFTYLGAVLSVDDLNELGLEAGAADEEAVDVGLGAQGRGRTGVHGPAVDDAHLYMGQQ